MSQPLRSSRPVVRQAFGSAILNLRRKTRAIVCRSASSSTSRSHGPSISDLKDFERLATQLQSIASLAREAGELAIASGPAGVRRAAQAAEAALALTRSQLLQLQSSKGLDPPPVLLRQLFEKLGATYIKLGQFIASSPTIFPAEYVLEFQKCLDQAPPVPFDTIRRTVESELGLALEDVFESVEQTPLASASVAQVHAAVLRGSRRDVVIKVLKPGVEDTLVTDLNFLYIASRALEIIAPDLARASLSAIAKDIRQSMLAEVDFRNEANNIEQFAAYLDSTGLRRIATVPSLYRQYCTKKVLVMERFYGVALTDLDAIQGITRGVDPEQVLINALNVWLGSVVGAETFHADVHAGNLLVLPDSRVAFIDFGIVGKIGQPTWRAIEAFLRASSSGNYDTMARALVTIGVTSEDVDIDAFARDLRALATSFESVNPELIVTAASDGVGATTMQASVITDDVALNKLLLELVRVGEDNGVRFPREFALLIKQILYFDRYTKILAPKLKVFEDDRVNMQQYGQADWDVRPGDYKTL